MGFNNCHIPNLSELTIYYNEYGLKKLCKRFRKYDSWTGDSDAMNYLESKVKEYEEVIRIDIDNDIGGM